MNGADHLLLELLLLSLLELDDPGWDFERRLRTRGGSWMTPPAAATMLTRPATILYTFWLTRTVRTTVVLFLAVSALLLRLLHLLEKGKTLQFVCL
jgi:hypothetical protein